MGRKKVLKTLYLFFFSTFAWDCFSVDSFFNQSGIVCFHIDYFQLKKKKVKIEAEIWKQNL